MPLQRKTGKHIHLVGVGGAGISSIARVLLGRGFAVSGSDQQPNQLTKTLQAEGATIYEGHKAEHVAGADLVVRSSAVPEDNIELTAAKKAGIPILKRADFLGSLMADSVGIAISGTHGKTTTTGMIAHILLKCRLDPTIVVGGHLTVLGSNGYAGKGHHFVVEADEYDNMFLGLRPKVTVVTNVEYDHPDIFTSAESYREAFNQFVKLIPGNGGRLILCGEDEGAMSLLNSVADDVQKVIYGIGDGVPSLAGVNALRAHGLALNQYGGYDFQLSLNGKVLGPARLRVPGRHNVQNALAAIAVALYEGLGYKHISHTLSTFAGVGRRFELKGNVNGISIIDDYAHHPTEIRATLAAARDQYPTSRIWAVWQPHTFSRLEAFQEQFTTCFDAADRVIVLDVYRSREGSKKIDLGDLVKRIKHDQVSYTAQMAQATRDLLEALQPNDVVLTLNAGDAYAMSEWLVDGLREMASDTFAESNDQPQHQQAQLDATAEQVRRLMAKLQED